MQDGSLRKRGQLVRLQEKPFQALAVLLEHAGELVTRDELQKRLWPETHVEFDDNLNAAIKRLREALGDSAESPRFIETVPRRGYRFIAPLERVDVALPVSPAANRRRWARAVLVVAMSALSVTSSGDRMHQPPHPYRLLVAPLLNLGPPEQQYFARGLTEEMTGHLRHLDPQRLAVIASSGPDNEGADYLVKGVVERNGVNGSLTVELIRTRDRVRLWSETFRLPIQEVFVSSAVAQRVSRSLALRLRPQERTELSHALTVNTDAHESYLRGLDELHRATAASLQAAGAWFEKSLQQDPQFGAPYAGLARTYVASARLHLIPASQADEKARQVIERGMNLDPAIAALHTLRADLAAQQPGSHQEVVRSFQRAIQLDPNDVEAHEHYALYLRERNPGQALVEIETARNLDPLSPWLNACAGWVLISNGQLDEAGAQLHHALDLDPNLPHTMRFMASLEMRRGRMDAAINWFEKAANASGREPFFVYRLGLAYASVGREERVRGLLAELRSDATRRFVDPEFIRSLQSTLGS